MKKLRKFITFFILVTIIFTIAGCSKQTSNRDKAKEFLELILTAPTDEISEIMDPDSMRIDSKNIDKKMKAALKKITKDYVAEDAQENAANQLNQDIIAYQATAASSNIECKVEKIEIESSTSEEHFAYVASMVIYPGDKQFEIRGRIQFDSNGKINFVTIPFSHQQMQE